MKHGDLLVNEAMASGVPVIATKESGATKDLIESGVTGYLGTIVAI